jgi:hypothetical protein
MADSNFVQLKKTEGTFEARGVLFNLKSERAFTEKTVAGGKTMRFANIGLRIADGEVMFLSFSRMEQEFVYFSKPSEKKGEKGTTEKVEYAKAKRNDFHKEGYKLIGMGLALTKDENGKNEEVKYLDAFDGIKYIEDHAEDGMSVFVKGKIEFGSYEDNNTKELRKTVKYVPTGIFLAKEPINFQDEKFEKSANFTQPIVFNAVRREIEDKDVKYYIDCGVVGYEFYQEVSIEASEVLAKALKENIKSNQGITLTGKIKSTQNVEVVVAEVWGEESKMGKARNSSKTIMFADGAPKTVDTTTYNKKDLETYILACEEKVKAKAAKKAGFESQESGSWGEKSESKTEESAW